MNDMVNRLEGLILAEYRAATGVTPNLSQPPPQFRERGLTGMVRYAELKLSHLWVTRARRLRNRTRRAQWVAGSYRPQA